METGGSGMDAPLVGVRVVDESTYHEASVVGAEVVEPVIAREDEGHFLLGQHLGTFLAGPPRQGEPVRTEGSGWVGMNDPEGGIGDVALTVPTTIAVEVGDVILQSVVAALGGLTRR